MHICVCVQSLESELRTLDDEINQIKTDFDERLNQLFNKWLRVQMAVLQQEYKVWRLKWMLLIVEELDVKYDEFIENIKQLNIDLDMVI